MTSDPGIKKKGTAAISLLMQVTLEPMRASSIVGIYVFADDSIASLSPGIVLVLSCLQNGQKEP